MKGTEKKFKNFEIMLYITFVYQKIEVFNKYII